MYRLSDVSYSWVLLSIFLSILSHLLRAYRWNLMLAPLGYKLETGRSFLAVMSGYLANLAFPRLGEVTRCGVLKKNDDVPISISFGTVVIERLIDVLILASVIAIDFFVEFDKIYDFFLDSVDMERFAIDKSMLMIWAFVFLVLGIVGVVLMRRLLRHDFTNPYLKKGQEKIKDLILGFMSIRRLENVWGFVLSTIGIWFFYYLMSYVIFYSIPETSGLGLGAGLSILAAAGVAMATPVQGGIGAYHALVSGVLIVYGVDSVTALFFATLLHTSQVIFMLVFGGASIVISSFISKKTEQEKD